MLFSIVIPTYNRPQALARCLDSLLSQNFDVSHAEVLVVDDGGHCDLHSVVGYFAPKLPVRLLQQANAGPGAARNCGARQARGQYLVFIDDDCLATPNWLSDYAQGFGRDPQALWGGKVLTDSQQNLYCQAAQAVVDMVHTFFNHDPDRARFFSSNNFAVPTARFLEMGGFTDHFRIASEDRDFCDRWSHAGLRLRSWPGAAIYHEPSLSLRSYLRMYFRYGRGAFRFQHTRTLRGSGSLQQDTRFHLHLPRLLSQASRRVTLWKRPALLALLAGWQIANLVGFLYEQVVHKLHPSQNAPHNAAHMVDNQVAHRT